MNNAVRQSAIKLDKEEAQAYLRQSSSNPRLPSRERLNNTAHDTSQSAYCASYTREQPAKTNLHGRYSVPLKSPSAEQMLLTKCVNSEDEHGRTRKHLHETL